MSSARAGRLSLYLFVSLGTVAPEAWAYLDPSTGSMILSAIIGMFATAALALKTFWYRLKGLFRRPQPGRRDPAGNEEQTTPGTRPASD
jgi:hypothetical protein